MTIRQAVATGILAMTPALSGCLIHSHSVLKLRPPDVVLNATLDQLLKQVDERYSAIDSMTARVQVVACTGGSSQGVVKCYPSTKGYILLSKPEQIRVILLVPLLGSDFLDMVSDGKQFKMLINLSQDCAIVGSDTVVNSTQKGLYSLRPSVILDSLLIHGLEPDQFVSMTQDFRIPENQKKRKEIIEDPDYDIEFLSQPQGQVARTLHVVHIDRTNLLPWRQDIYNSDGRVATQAFYSNYQKFGQIDFPTKIVIQRPLDELSLTITVDKRTTFNQPLPANEFTLDIPKNYTVENVNAPAGASTGRCEEHAPQSPH